MTIVLTPYMSNGVQKLKVAPKREWLGSRDSDLEALTILICSCSPASTRPHASRSR